MPPPLPLHTITPDAPDRELLERYVRERDEQAFAAVVARHGRMVRAVCRRVLANDADAEDAVQATFLVLVTNAARIRDRTGLANWLFGVAHNVALKAKQTRTRRQAKERRTPPRPPEQVASDFAELLQVELAELPAAYRAAVVLCDLEGETIAAAARQLGVPPGTVASRLARGRTRLANRLRTLGLSVSAGLLAGWLEDTCSAAVRFDPDPPAHIHTLAEAMRTMKTPKLFMAVALVAAVGVTAGVVPWWSPADPPRAAAAPIPKEKKLTAKELLAGAEEQLPAIKDLVTRAEYTKLVAAEYALCGETEQANKVFAASALHYRAVKSTLYCNIPPLMAEVGMGKEWQAMYDDLSKLDPKWAGYMRVHSCLAHAKAGRLKPMEEMLDLLAGGGGEYAAYLAAKAYLAAGEFDKAEKQFNSITDPSGRVELRGLEAAAYHKAGKKEAAEKALQAAVEFAEKATQEEKDADKRAGYAALVLRAKLAVAPADKRTAAHTELLATIAGIKSKKQACEELLATVDADLLAGDVKGATAAAEACGIDGWADRCRLRIADHHLAKGETEKLLKIVEGMKRPYWEARGRLRLAEALGKGGKADDAKKQAAAAEKLVGPFGDGWRPGYVEGGPPEGNMQMGPEFARAWVAAGEAEAQKTAAEKLPEPFQRAFRLLTLAKGFRPPSLVERFLWAAIG